MTLLQVLGLFIFPNFKYLWEYFAQITEPSTRSRQVGVNLVPSVSLLCLPWSLEERPWLRLVTWSPRIWVAKKSVVWEGWQSYLLYSLYRGSNFADEESYTISAVFKIQKTFVHKEIRPQNGAETFWLLANDTGSNWHHWISLLNLWIRR